MNTFGRITVQDCINTVPPLDPRCQDRAFALANPDICPSRPYLVIKPGFSIACSLGSTQFRAFLVTNGIEDDVTTDSIWRTSDDSIALIGAASGNATGLTAGSVTISATYGDYTATADFDVLSSSLDCCSSRSVAMMMLVDTSRSMSQAFGSSYATRLDFAKVAAAQFATEVNATKDTVGLISFNDDAVTSVDALTADKATVATDVAAVAQTQQLTSFYDALSEALTQLLASSADLKVVVLFSDGEDTGADAGNGYQNADNPIQLLADFRDSGGIVMCVGCRASGTGYSLLSEFATGGFFVNAYPAIAANALDYVSGLKGYICAGNCTPAGDVYVGTPALNYSDFTNWNVVDGTYTDGTVDLIGEGMFDFLPGNGLYVDLAGSGTLTQHSGRMVSKVGYSLTSGNQYRLALDLAGNQREADRTDSALVKVFYLVGTNEVVLASQNLVIADYRQDLHTYSLTFTAPAAVTAYISIELGPVASGMNPNFGLLLDNVKFDDITTQSNLLNDTFDNENLTYVPPRCGLATTFVSGGYAYGYNCYGTGCLDTPPPEQTPDPNPLPDIEQGYTPPETFTSTVNQCASCEVNETNLTTIPWTLVSSQAGPPNILILQLDDGAAVVHAFSIGQISFSNCAFTDFTVSGSNDNSTWTELFSASSIEFFANSLQYYPFDGNTTAYLYYKFEAVSVMPPANVLGSLIALTLYSTATQTVCADGTGTGSTQFEADQAATTAAQAAADALLNCQSHWTRTESVTLSCPAGTCGNAVTRLATRTSFISEQDAINKAIEAATALAQAVIDADCTDSNNTQPNPVTDAPAGAVGLASLFPQVQYISGGPASIATIAVNLYGFTHQWPSDIQMFLQGPDGTCVGLMRKCGGSTAIAAPGVDLVLQDGSPAVPTPIVAGTYAPTAKPASVWAFSATFTPTAPTAPASFALSDFIGKDGNGAWALWIIDDSPGSTGTLAGGFEVVLT